jgi:A/G-specific adenine glycosylase
MLQQTTVATATPRWKRFLARFPDVEALAGTAERDVLAEWAGLGYYARARNLRKAAQAVARAGAFPRTLDGWRALPGVGPYTAAAVSSICFRVPAAVVDGNAARVLARLHALRLDPKSAAGARRLRAAAEAMLVPSSPGDFNQALMELGATLCAPRAPRCGACPLRAGCLGRRTGRPESFPKPPKRINPRTVHLAAGVARRRGRLLLVEDREFVRGHWTVPLVEVRAGGRPAEALRRAWEGVAGRKAAAARRLGTLRHSVLDRRYRVEVFLLEERPPSAARRARGAPRLRLLSPGELTAHPHGGLTIKVLRLLTADAAPPS